MPCCGNQRAHAAAAPFPIGKQRPRPVSPAASATPAVTFEYTGETALTVTGPVTRTVYRFPVPGAKVAVDAGDARAVAGVPNVRRTTP